MDKQDFIDRLRAALNGKVTPGQVIENVNYYEEYINTQIRKGRTEEEVLADLGDPRLIAKSIVTANGTDDYVTDTAYGAESSYGSNAGQQGNQGTFYYQNTKRNGYDSDGFYEHSRSSRLPKWIWVLFSVLIVLLIIGMIFSVLSFLAPIIIPILVVMFFVKLFRDWLN